MKTSSDLSSLALQLLRKLDIRVAAGGRTDWHLILPNGLTHSVRVQVRRQPPPPSWVKNLRPLVADTSLLIVTGHITPYLREQAQQRSLDVIDIENETAIIAGSTFALTPSDSLPGYTASVARGRKPWVRWATERLLMLSDEPITQAEIAAALAVTQQSVSYVLRAHRYARRAVDGWSIKDKRRQLDGYLLEYPGPGGASAYWFQLGYSVQQADDATSFIAEMGMSALRTGDAAADKYAPWRLPLTASIYSTEILDFTPAGFTPAGIDEHTLRVTVPEDSTIWKTAAVASSITRRSDLVDPIVALYDVLRSPGADAAEAADRLRQAIIEGSWRG
ncbi:hypothetical protein [Rhodococcoides kyotonense]|uniref:Uncharacterized protein n=1 Tax=Rhodococcoides kyotonense TaxID=398843 RepID=A0A239L799_9NOCA|nr:hypothetical protein [Rhodococcus kyotonensis]SNT25733.1 hypothetical protein SAMN05421642_11255 [Rhodococcus kyotonensis]